MKKIIIVSAAYFAITSLAVNGQSKKIAPPPPPPVMDIVVPPPPPPPPPPPAAPLPPPPPIPLKEFTSGNVDTHIEIVNSNGSEMQISKIKGISTVVVSKDGRTQRIRLSTWNANRKFYEKKYGQLPPPPPAPPIAY